MTPESESIAQRVEELEKQVAHLEALIVEHSDPDKPVAARSVAARSIAARSFVVMDENWKQRAVLGMRAPAGQTEEHPCLLLLDASERQRVCIRLDADGPLFDLVNASGKKVAEIREYPDGPSLGLCDSDGRPGIALTVQGARSSKGHSCGDEGIRPGSFLYLFSPDGKQNVRLELFSSGQASLVMQAPNGEPRIGLVVGESGEASVALFKDNDVGWTAP